jgi:2-methylaconitate cis-trans-isomerase PrpF
MKTNGTKRDKLLKKQITMQTDSTIQLASILKVADVNSSDLSKKTVDFIVGNVPIAYPDVDHAENIYNLIQYVNKIGLAEVDAKVGTQITEILGLMKENNCTYLRLI